MTVKPMPNGIERCDECGFEYAQTAGEVPGALRSIAARFEALLTDPGRAGEDSTDILRRRPAPDVWSALAYACHVRDLQFTQRERLYVILVEDDPTFSPMYREERVALAGYEDEDPARVAAELVVGADLLGRSFAALRNDHWERSCRYNYPVVAERSLLWVAQHTLHEGEHHLQDAERVLAAVSGADSDP